jgi:hypothetical protein
MDLGCGVDMEIIGLLSPIVTLNTIETITTFSTSKVAGPANDSVQLETLGYDIEGDTVRINFRYDSVPTSRTDGTLLFAFPMADSADYHDTTFEWTGLQDTTIFIAGWPGKGSSFVVAPNEDSVGLWIADTANSFEVSFAYADAGNELTDDLFAYYNLEESSGDALDQVGSNDLSVNGTVTRQQTGIRDDCYTFATNGYLGEINDEFEFTGPFSFSLWFKTSTTSIGYLFSNFGAAAYGYTLFVYDWGGGVKVNFRTRDGVSNVLLSSSTTINDNAWHHVVATMGSDDSIKLWVDGDLEDYDLSDGVVYNTNCRFTLGRRDGTGVSQYFLDGELDEIAVYDIELSGTKVDSLYNSGVGKAYPFTGGEDADSVRLQMSGVDIQADSFQVRYSYTQWPTLVTEGSLQFAFALADTGDYNDTTFEWTGYNDTIVYFTMFTRVGGAWSTVPNKDTVQIGIATAPDPDPDPTGFNIIFSMDWDHHTGAAPVEYIYDLQVGDFPSFDWYYTDHRWPEPWDTFDGIRDSIVVDGLSNSAVYKVSFSDTIMNGYDGQGPARGGEAFSVYEGFRYPTRTYNEMYFSINVRPMPGIDLSRSDKLIGGFWGGSAFGHGEISEPDYGQGFSAEVVIAENDQSADPDWHLLWYLYSQDKPDQNPYGDVLAWDEFQPTGTGMQYGEINYTGNLGWIVEKPTSSWFNVTIRCVTNTHIGSSPVRNGILEGFVNGKLVSRQTGLYLITYPDIDNLINRYTFRSFFGGSSPVIDDCWIYYDDMVIWYYDNDADVVRGNNAWPEGTQLTLPSEADISKIDL